MHRFEGVCGLFVTGCDDNFGARCDPERLLEQSQSLAGPVGIGRKAEINNRHWRALSGDDRECRLPRVCHEQLMFRQCPTILATQTVIVLDDEELGLAHPAISSPRITEDLLDS